ncbi:MAG: F-box protein, partial [Parachlamydiales bacterium]|nr:F-box protein [Parachlamydiales bacterium]
MTGINNTMDRITNDRLCDILKFLPYRNAFQACSVCKRFNLVINQDHFWKDIDLTSIFTNLRIIDKEFYRKYVNLNALNIDLEQFHVINKVKAIPILHKMLSSIPVVNGTGITLLTIPPHFHNAQLQDLKKADELSKNFLV